MMRSTDDGLSPESLAFWNGPMPVFLLLLLLFILTTCGIAFNRHENPVAKTESANVAVEAEKPPYASVASPEDEISEAPEPEEKFTKAEEAHIKKMEAMLPQAMRKIFAERYEERMLDSGMNVSITTLGPQDTTLKIEYILVNKVWAHKLGKDADFAGAIRKAGFKKLILTDGYDEEYTWNNIQS